MRLSEEQLAKFEEGFWLFDEGGDGTVATKDLGLVLRSVRLKQSCNT